jgi:hypothetical protein
MIDRGPFHRDFSAEFVIDDQMAVRRKVQDALASIICVATVFEEGGKKKLQVVVAKHGRLTELLRDYDLIGSFELPVFIVLGKYNPTSEAAPEPVS